MLYKIACMWYICGTFFCAYLKNTTKILKKKTLSIYCLYIKRIYNTYYLIRTIYERSYKNTFFWLKFSTIAQTCCVITRYIYKPSSVLVFFNLIELTPFCWNIYNGILMHINAAIYELHVLYVKCRINYTLLYLNDMLLSIKLILH